MSDRRLLRHAATVWALCWRAGWVLALVFCCVTIVAGLLPTATAWLTKLVVDRLVSGGPATGLITVAVALALVGTGVAIAPQVTGYLQEEIRRRIDRLLQDRLYTAVNGFQGLSRFEDPALLNKLRMATQATGSTLTPATTGVFSIAQSVITLVSMEVTLYFLSPAMAALVLVSAIPALVARLILSRSRIRMLDSMSEIFRRQLFHSTLITDVKAAKEVRLFGLGDFLKNRVLADLWTEQAGERRIARRDVGVQAGLAFLSAGIAGCGLVWAVRAAAAGTLSPGDVTAFVAAVAGTQAALAGLVGGVANAHEALLSFGYHAEMTSLPSDLPTAVPARELPALGTGIELSDVWFRYDDSHPWLLRGVSLTIPYGTSVALVGLNGAGKSTLIKLLCRFYDPCKGKISWDGLDIREVSPVELRRRMGVLFQDFMSYDLTATENIGVGDLAVRFERTKVRDAARRARVHDTLEALPDRYETMLSRSFVNVTNKDRAAAGVVLSGGQWQRVALARTLLRDGRDLLILDEPSSGLDARAEHDIHRELHDHRAGRTSLLVSHRLGAVRDADLIAVLADGRIVEQGSHHQLLGSGGRYAELFALQASGYRDDGSLESVAAEPPDGYAEQLVGVEEAELA